MTRLLLPLRIVLAMLAAAARCFRAQPLTHVRGASEHLETQVTASEPFFLFTPFAYMRGLSFWKTLHVLRSNAVPMHFRSSVGAGLHNITGQGGATGFAGGGRVRNVHVREAVAEHAAGA